MKAYRSTLNHAGEPFITLTMTEKEADIVCGFVGHQAIYSPSPNDRDIAYDLYDAIMDAVATKSEPSIVRSQSIEETQ
jgi:hypothetical protein